MKKKKMQSRKGRKIGLDAMLTNHRLKKRKEKSYWLQKEAGPQMTPKILNKNINRTFEKYNYMLI